jgi:hypothetical protein
VRISIIPGISAKYRDTYAAVNAPCSGCQNPPAVASISRLEVAVSEMIMSQARCLASADGRAARQRAANCSPVALWSRANSASISALPAAPSTTSR